MAEHSASPPGVFDMTKFKRRTALSVPVVERVRERGASPTAADIQDLARSKSEAAIYVLAKIMLRETSRASARVAAAKALLDRALGKVQRIESGGGSPAEQITRIQRMIVYPDRPPEEYGERAGEATRQENSEI